MYNLSEMRAVNAIVDCVIYASLRRPRLPQLGELTRVPAILLSPAILFGTSVATAPECSNLPPNGPCRVARAPQGQEVRAGLMLENFVPVETVSYEGQLAYEQ
jgi:hypothetical protein